jgi:Putative zinc-finger
MGTVTPDPCEHFHGLIAMEVVGQLSEQERVALNAHVEGCESCRDERRDLMTVSLVLGTADPDSFTDHELPFGLQTAVLDRLRAEERRERRLLRSRYVVASAAVAAVVALVVVLSLVWPSGPVTTTVALVGLPEVHATARLTAQPWGTALDLRESGQASGQVLSVSVRTDSGSWWQMGTYRTVGSSVHVTMACALKMSNIKSVWIRESSGHVLLHGYVYRT